MDVRIRLTRVICRVRAIIALPFLSSSSTTKTERIGRPGVLEILSAAGEFADAEKRSWIDEVLGQIPSATRSSPDRVRALVTAQESVAV